MLRYDAGLSAYSIANTSLEDCGGVRSLSQLRIMETIIHRIQYDRYPNDPEKVVLPCDCFDLMGGCDTGGYVLTSSVYTLLIHTHMYRIIVIMFCKFRMSVEDTMNEFYKICEEVYANGLSPEERSSRLRNCIEDLLKRKGFPVDLNMGKDDRLAKQGCPWCGIYSCSTFCNTQPSQLCCGHSKR